MLKKIRKELLELPHDPADNEMDHGKERLVWFILEFLTEPSHTVDVPHPRVSKRHGWTERLALFDAQLISASIIALGATKDTW